MLEVVCLWWGYILSECLRLYHPRYRHDCSFRYGGRLPDSHGNHIITIILMDLIISNVIIYVYIWCQNTFGASPSNSPSCSLQSNVSVLSPAIPKLQLCIWQKLSKRGRSLVQWDHYMIIKNDIYIGMIMCGIL